MQSASSKYCSYIKYSLNEWMKNGLVVSFSLGHLTFPCINLTTIHNISSSFFKVKSNSAHSVDKSFTDQTATFSSQSIQHFAVKTVNFSLHWSRIILWQSIWETEAISLLWSVALFTGIKEGYPLKIWLPYFLSLFIQHIH